MKQMGPAFSDCKNKIEFRVFAHDRKKVSLCFKKGEKEADIIPMAKEKEHFFHTTVLKEHDAELLYKFRLDEEGDFPDPYSNYQPEGVHGFSQVIDHDKYRWQCTDWRGINLAESIIYELHTGTFTQSGTFRAAAEKLDYLAELGVNAIELMPVAQNPGKWNWGYDGANLFSVNNNYGTPDDLKFLIDCCHMKGMAVILDVVYNHFGPEGNYLPVYGPYFTHKHETPWGAAVNFDDDYSEVVRRMILDNVQYWIKIFRVDALRLDAVHAIIDNSDTHILREIADSVKHISSETGRRAAVIAETDENNTKIIKPPEKGGYGADAQWMDDFHHCVHTALTGESNGYYADFGNFSDFEKVYKNYIYTGQYSQFWKKPRGTDGAGNPGHQFVTAIQTHDQVGNRATGDRLSSLVHYPFIKAAAGLLFFSPYIPMLFMGEEYAEKNPFLFFTDYIDTKLKNAVSEGRKKEFADFDWDSFPDPEKDSTFFSSVLTERSRWEKSNQDIFNFYRDLISLRRSHPALKTTDKSSVDVKADENNRVIIIKRRNGNRHLSALFNLGRHEVPLKDFINPEDKRQVLNSEWKNYGGNIEGESIYLTDGQMIVFEDK